MTLAVVQGLVSLFYNNLLATSPRVTVPGVGTVSGTTVKSALLDRDIHGFWAVPYGAPPTGSRRFSAPEPAPPLNDGRSRVFRASQLRFLLGPDLRCSQPAAGGG